MTELLKKIGARAGDRRIWFDAAIGAVVALLLLTATRGIDFWITPDQQGDWLMRRGEYAEAARRYLDPLRIGTAWFRAGDFKQASVAFGRLKTPETRFNQGNAWVMQGKYQEAVEAYEAALGDRPNWQEAKDNREIARLRAQQLKKEGGDMTGGQLEADEIVFDSTKKDGDNQQTETTEGGQALQDSMLQEIWLRRIQTKPADFLRAKFAYQAQQEETAK